MSFARWCRHVLGEVIAPSDLLSSELRITAYRRAGIDIGRDCRIEAGQHFVQGHVSIGNRVYINRDGLFDAYLTRIVIEDDVTIGAGAILAASSHRIGRHERRAGADEIAPICVGAGVWLGARVVVLPGVSIGAGGVVGASSLVTRDTEPDALYVGSPARLVRRFAD